MNTELTGTIQRVVYFDEDTNYCVLQANHRGEPATVAVVGVMLPQPNAGDHFAAKGQWANHPKHGRQFKVEQIETRPATSQPLSPAQNRFLDVLAEIQREMKQRKIKRFAGPYEEVLNHMLNKAFKLGEPEQAVDIAVETLAAVRGESKTGHEEAPK